MARLFHHPDDGSIVEVTPSANERTLIELLLAQGYRPIEQIDLPERIENIDTNEPGDLSPEDERLAEGLR